MARIDPSKIRVFVRVENADICLASIQQLIQDDDDFLAALYDVQDAVLVQRKIFTAFLPNRQGYPVELSVGIETGA